MFQCDNCKKIFSTKQRLQTHMNRKFKCQKLEEKQKIIIEEKVTTEDKPMLEDLVIEFGEDEPISPEISRRENIDKLQQMERELVENEEAKYKQLLKKYKSTEIDEDLPKEKPKSNKDLVKIIGVGLLGIVSYSLFSKTAHVSEQAFSI